MPMGPGKYDKQCEAVMLELKADAVLLIVLGGPHGAGFSMCTTSLEAIVKVPEILRTTAKGIEDSVPKA